MSMTIRDRYRETFSRLHASPETLREVLQMTEENNAGKLRSRGAGRRITSLALAAALLIALGVTAYAVGLSIHKRRQEALRQSLGVQNAPAYVEYETDKSESKTGEDTPTITLLSALREGEYQRVFLDVGPVAKEELAYDTYDKGNLHFVYSIDGGVTWLPAPYYVGDQDYPEEDMDVYTSYFGEEIRVPKREAITRRIREESYDAESRTVPIICGFHTEGLGESVEIRVALTDDLPALFENWDAETCGRYLLRDYGSLPFTLTQADRRLVLFPEPVRITWEETGTEYRIRGVELDSSRAELLMDCPDIHPLFDKPENETDEAFHARFEAQLRWAEFIDGLWRETVLTLDDGSQLAFRGSVDFVEEGGDSIRECSLYPGQVIDVSRVTAITIRGETIALN